MSITGEFDGLILAAAIVSERILLSSASACKLNLHATGSTARVRAFSGDSFVEPYDGFIDFLLSEGEESDVH